MERARSIASLAIIGIMLPIQWASPQVVKTLSNVQYDLKLLVNDQPVNFHVSWRCKWGYNFPNMGPGDILQRVLKPTVSDSWIARELPGGSVLFSQLRTSCYGESTYEYDPPSIYIIDNPANPHLLQIFSRRRQVGLGYTIRIVSAALVDSGKAEADYSDTRQTRRLMDSVRNSCPGYQRVVAHAFPESGWRRATNFSEQFSGLTTFSLGPFRNMDYFNSTPVYHLPLIRQGATWRLPAVTAAENMADVYSAMDGPPQTTDKLRGDDLGRRIPPATIEFDGVQFPLELQPKFGYDPTEHWIIKFDNQKFNCWSLR